MLRTEMIDLQTDTSLRVSISEVLSEQDKVKFTVYTKTTLKEFKNTEFTTVREHKEFVWLHDRFVKNDDYAGIVIPPPPPRPDFDEHQRKLHKFRKDEENMTQEEYTKMKQKLEAEYRATFKKTTEMHEIFLQHLAAHPTLRKDHNFLVFLEFEGDVSKLKKKSSWLSEPMKKLSVFNTEQSALINELKAQVRKLEEEKETLQNEVQIAKTELSHLETEKDALLQAARAEQLQMRQLTQEKDQFIQSLQSEKDQLRQQLSALSGQIQRYAQQPQSQRPHESDFWEVPRHEITLNMQKFLGTGAWGFVVEGKFRGQQVAVKCLHDLIRQPEVVEIIRKEICIMAQIRHPNLVMLIAAVIDAENDPLIVTELLDISLRKAYEKHRLQSSSKLSIFRDVASALNYLHLHQRGEIIHRDVSSANVLLEAKPNNQWKAKLSDFGSAKLAIEAKTTGPGAPAYTAPEVRKEMGIRQTAKLDVYSYGIVLCEVIVGQFPMEGSLPSMIQVVRSRWPLMHDLITSCIQENPDNRPTMSFVLGEFDKLRPQK